MTKKIICVILAIFIVASAFSACSNSSDKNTDKSTSAVAVTNFATDDQNFKLSYTQSDSLNPFKAKSLNNQVLSTLVFRSLFKLDEKYSAGPDLATGYEYVDATTLKVTIPSGLTFSDGSALSSADVVYSFNAAHSSPAYGSSLSAISSASSESDTTIVFNLNYKNPYAHNLLTFPIASTDDDKNSNPMGNGRYKYKPTNHGMTLVANKEDGFNPHITTIKLVNIAAADSIDNAVNIGNISYAFRDLSENSTKRMTSAKKPISTNNIVYLGINSKSSVMSNVAARKAVSLAIDRSVIAKSAYSGYATAAESIYNPSFELSGETKLFATTADSAAAKQQLNLADISSSEMKITLLTNKNVNKSSAANLIKSQLEAIGFSVIIEEENYKTYLSKVKNLDFDLYIGETKLPNDMCFNSFFTSVGSTHYGITVSSSKTAKAYQKYLAGDDDLGKYILAFSEEMPFVPILYKKAMICYSKSLKGDMQGYFDNYFSNINDWYFE